MKRSPRYSAILDLIHLGKLGEAREAAFLDREIEDWERAELLSLTDFHCAKVRFSEDDGGALSIFFWRLLLASASFRWLARTALRNFARLHALFSRGDLFATLYRRVFPNFIHYRYTNFLVCLNQSFLLSSVATRKHRVEGVYLEGVFGHMLCLSGRFDIGIAYMRRNLERLRILWDEAPDSERRVMRFFYLELAVAHALDLMLAGHTEESRKSFEKLFAHFTEDPYYWGESFCRSMRMTLSLELLDDTALQEDTIALKRLLGTAFEGQFALRASIFSALLSAIKKNFRASQTHLLQSDHLYPNLIVPVEKMRYHAIRALLEIEYGDSRNALHHSHRAVSYMAPQRGSIYQVTDAEMLDLEVKLRAQLIHPDPSRMPSLSREAKRVFKKARRIKGAPIFTLRSNSLLALLYYLQGNFSDAKELVARLAPQLKGQSRRLENLLRQFEAGTEAKSLPVRNRTAVDIEVESYFIESIIELLREETLGTVAPEFLTRLFGADDCEIAITTSKKAGRAFDVNPTANGDFEIFIYLEDRTIEYRLRSPLAHLLFDRHVESALRLALSVIHSTYSRAWILENQKNLAIADLAQQVAHDIRSPLNALGIMLTMASGMPDNLKVLTRSAIGRINDIANDLLDRSRTSVSSDEEPSVQLLSSLVDSIVTEKRFQYRPLMGVSVETDIGPASYGLFSQINPAKFKQSLSNLINNAVESLKENGRVVVGLRERDNRISLDIVDDGDGIEPEILTRLGEKGATFGKTGGSGLGIHYARTFAESLGGRLRIQSRLGQGTTVSLELPKSPAPSWFVPAIELRPMMNVVVLDDDITVHQIWKRRFETAGTEKLGIRAHYFATARALEKWMSDHGISKDNHLFLFDFELAAGEPNGLELIERFHLEACCHLVTSRAHEEIILKRCAQLGVSMIPKEMVAFVPLRLAALSAGVETVRESAFSQAE